VNTPWGLFSLWGRGQNGEIANDCQSQRALGVDHRSRNLRMPFRTVAGAKYRQRNADGFEFGCQGDGRADGAEEVHEGPPREIRAA
jgi:hypothetical protein